MKQLESGDKGVTGQQIEPFLEGKLLCWFSLINVMFIASG